MARFLVSLFCAALLVACGKEEQYHQITLRDDGMLTIAPLQVKGWVEGLVSQGSLAQVRISNIKDARLIRKYASSSPTVPSKSGVSLVDLASDVVTLRDGVATFTGLSTCDVLVAMLVDEVNTPLFFLKEKIRVTNTGSKPLPIKVGEDGLIYIGTAATNNGSCSQQFRLSVSAGRSTAVHP